MLSEMTDGAMRTVTWAMAGRYRAGVDLAGFLVYGVLGLVVAAIITGHLVPNFVLERMRRDELQKCEPWPPELIGPGPLLSTPVPTESRPAPLELPRAGVPTMNLLERDFGESVAAADEMLDRVLASEPFPKPQFDLIERPDPTYIPRARPPREIPLLYPVVKHAPRPIWNWWIKRHV